MYFHFLLRRNVQSMPAREPDHEGHRRSQKGDCYGGVGIKINLPKARCLQAAERPDIITKKIGDITKYVGYITNIIGETNVGTASWI